MKNQIALLLLIVISMGFRLDAQEIITDRPDQTESSSTVPYKSFQIESGLMIGFTKEHGFSDHQLLLPTTLLRFGLTRIIELRFVHQLEELKIGETAKHILGMSDLEIGAKFQILKKEDVNGEIAFLSHLILPVGTNGLSGDKFGVVNKIAASHSLIPSLGLGYNLGYNYWGEGNGDLTYSVALGFGLAEKVGMYVEAFGEYAGFENWHSNFDTGITYLVKNNLQLDVSYGVGLNQKMNYFAVGFSWNIAPKQNQ